MTRMSVLKSLALGAGLLFGVSAAYAGPYSAEYVFGDSLSDNGNLAAALGFNFPFPPSYNDSFTNGSVAVQVLAKGLGLTLDPSLWTTGSIGAGTNYAVAGATSALAAVGGPVGINLPEQVGAFSLGAGGVADPSALYIIMIGGNDVRNAALQATGAPAVEEGVQTELAAISTLSGEGAKDFLIVNVPNVGIIPEFAQDNPSLAAEATTYSQDYDVELAQGLAALDGTLPVGTSLDQFDLYGFNSYLLANAASYGFTNTTDRCFTDTPLSAATSPQCGPDAENIDSFVYWDEIHPTARVQALWAHGMGEALGLTIAVPEVSTWSMMLIGFASFGFVGFRSARRQNLARAAKSVA